MRSLLFSELSDCASAINRDDLNLAESIFKKIQSEIAADTNRAAGKVFKYFAEALVRRLYNLYPRNSMPLVPSAASAEFYDYVFHPFFWFALLTSHQAMVNAFVGRNQVHVIDFSFTTSSWRWYTLMKELAKQAGGRLISFRLTCIGPKLSENLDHLQVMREKLTTEGRKIGIDFELRKMVANTAGGIIKSIHKVRRRSENEAIVVNWEYQLHKLLAVPDAVEQVLSKVKGLKPELMIVVEQEANHNSPDLLDRFTNLIQYYPRVFDSIEEVIFEEDNDFKFVWEMYFRRQISNVLAQEGIGVVERQETLIQWQDRFRQAGFLPIRLSIKGVKGKVQNLTSYTISRKDHGAMLCLENLPLAVASAWKPDPAHFGNGSDFDHLIGELEEESNPEPHDEQSEDQTMLGNGNPWSPECFTINQIASAAEIFDILEYVCHVHKLPLALTWLPEGRDANSNRTNKLRIENTACYVNDLEMKEFVEACAEVHLEEGQGVVGKALLSNKHFVSDVSKLDAVDYPFAQKAVEFGLHSAFAIKIESSYTNNDGYILEFFLPQKMRTSSEQERLIHEISCTMQQSCRNLRIVSDNSGFHISNIQNSRVPYSITPAAFPSISSSGLPSISSLNSSQRRELSSQMRELGRILNQTDDEEDMPEANNQEVEEQHSSFEPVPLTDNMLVNTDDSAQTRGAKKRARTSEVWNYFDEIRVNGEVWAICKGCNARFRGESTRGTTSLRRHQNSCPARR